MRKDNILEVIKFSKILIRVDVKEIEGLGGLFVTHPYTSNRYHMVHSEHGFDLIDVIEQNDMFINDIDRVVDLIASRYKDKSNLSMYFAFVELVNKPYRLYFMKMTEKYVSEDTFAHTLFNILNQVEFIANDSNVSLCELKGMVRRAGKTLSKQRESSIEKLYSGNSSIRLYRGVHDEAINITGALSWTIDRNIAEFFANRFRRGEAEIWEVDLKIDYAKNILWVIGGNESEVLFDYTKYNKDTKIDLTKHEV